MAQLGIIQVRDPRRRQPLAGDLPAGSQIRAVDLDSPAQRDLAARIVARLRRVAGQVCDYYPFRPESGMGLAAPQLGIGYRIAIVRPPHRDGFVELINPRVAAAGRELADAYEGCLSFFDVRGVVRRPVGVTVSHDRLGGEPVTAEFTGAFARIVQHEIDHLDGKRYTDADRMPPGSRLVPLPEYRARWPG